MKKAKWLPDRDVDIVHLYSDTYIDVRNPQPITTHFFKAIRQEKGYEHNWLMCNEQTKKKLENMNFEHLRIIEITVKG